MILKIFIYLTWMFSFALNIFSHYLLDPTEDSWLLWEASFANILNPYYCCFLPIIQMGPLVKPLSEITGTTKDLEIFYHSFQCCFQQLDYIEQVLGPTAFAHFLNKVFHVNNTQYTSVKRSCGASSFCWPSPPVLFCSLRLELCFCFILDFDQDFIIKTYFKTVPIMNIC